MINVKLIKKSCIGIALMALSFGSITTTSAQVVRPEPKPALSVPPAVVPQVKTEPANAPKLPNTPGVSNQTEPQSDTCDVSTGSGC